MNVINFAEQNSIINQYMAELRDKNYQRNRMLFRHNIARVGEMMAYELSKTLEYKAKTVTTPLGTLEINLPKDDVLIATVLRAGLPFHEGFLHVFDKAENAFVSAYRKYLDEVNFDVHIEYMASPKLDGKTLILVDPMLATGNSMYLAYRALLLKGTPAKVHLCSVIAAQAGVDYVCKMFPQDTTTLWCAAVDPELNSHAYIIPGLGDAGDLCFGEK